MKIQGITIQKPTGDQTLEVGARLLDKDGNETEITVTKITIWFGVVRTYFSDGRMLVFRKFPFIVTKK